jgi:menaquinol-cytochrome c reductase iron-sulfur subunit
MPAAKQVAVTAESAPPTRRSFLTRFMAIFIGGFLGLIPLAAGIAVFVDPLRRKSSVKGGGRDEEGFIKVASLDGLRVEEPQRFAVIDDLYDAWNVFPDEPIGAVYLTRNAQSEVHCLNVTCPHAGCAVDYNSERKVFQCPCHDSAFLPDGELASASSPAARGLDPLEVRIKNEKEIWVRYKNFRSGIAERIPEA